MVDLSVLICSTNTRWRTFGHAIQEQIWPQYEALAPGFRDAAEILMLTDTKHLMLGAKRNAMVDIAQGRYITFVDDDDRISDDYLASLLDAIARNPADVITFQVSVSLNGDPPLTCYYSKDYPGDRNLPDRYERLPNHLMCVKRDIAAKVAFPHIPYGEDAGYSKQLAPLLATEHAINRVLYHYDYSDATTETQQYKRNRLRPRRNQEPLVDVIILSDAANKDLRRMTQATINSAMLTSSLPLNIVVLEQQPRITYRDTITIRMSDEFNYNRYANRGAAAGRAPWILVCNNDLLFHPGWLDHLLAADHPLVSPKCPRDPRQTQFTTNTVGDHTGQHLSGWCYMIKRSLWEQIGGLDDCVNFWCSDDVVIEQAKTVGVQPMIVPAAHVEHIQSVTLKQRANCDDLTWRQIDIFSQKYGEHRLARDPRFLRWKAHNP